MIIDNNIQVPNNDASASIPSYFKHNISLTGTGTSDSDTYQIYANVIAVTKSIDPINTVYEALNSLPLSGDCPVNGYVTKDNIVAGVITSIKYVSTGTFNLTVISATDILIITVTSNNLIVASDGMTEIE